MGRSLLVLEMFFGQRGVLCAGVFAEGGEGVGGHGGWPFRRGSEEKSSMLYVHLRLVCG